MYAVADTHALLWYLIPDPHLSTTAHATFNEAAEKEQHIGIPSIAWLRLST